MFKIPAEKELNTELLQKMINRFTINVYPNLKKYKDYYDGIQAILNKTYSDASKPCNRTVTNFCKNIADSYCGYLASAGYITYSSDEDISEIINILNYNDYQSEDSDFLLDALVYGTAAELMYIDSEAHTRFKLINPLNCFGVYDDSLTNDLLYFVRWYDADEWNDSNLLNVDVYSAYTVRHYTMMGLNGGLTLQDEEPHYFSQCPANIFYLPDEKPIFDCILSKQDSYNTVFNASLDDYEAFVDAFLLLNGVDADNEDIASMKEDRVLILPDGSSASWLTKNDTSAGIEAKLKRIQDDIYKIASCPDFSSESFTGGVSSGIAIRYKLCGMENRAAKVAALMKKALQRRIEIICGIASLKLGEAVFRDIQISMKRNIPEDITENISVVEKLKGTISDKTLIAQLPFIQDVEAELEAVNKQKEDNIALYSFSRGAAADGEEQ